MKTSMLVALTAVVALATAPGSPARAGEPVDYPRAYRGWTHVKSMVILEGHPLHAAFGGIHHVYANDRALEALRNGRSFPDGSVFVFDLLEAVPTDDHALVEGARKVVGVMEKDSRRFADTGGWGFEGFRGDTRERVVTDAKSACFACHTQRRDHDYVFSSYRR